MDDGAERVESWAELHEALYAGSWDERLRRHRSRRVFRGASVAGRGLRPGLSTLGGEYEAKERHLLRNFRKYAHRSFRGDASLWNWLALAQHHGLPTRLLDWTFSPFVALHFATADLTRFHADGEVWAIDLVETNRFLPQALREQLEREDSQVFTGEMLSAVAASPKALDALWQELFLLFLEPPSLDDRIVNQAALFSILSDPRASVEDWLSEHAGAARRYVVPAALKWEVRDKLDQANFTERVLFPGLDGLTAWLARYYSEPESR